MAQEMERRDLATTPAEPEAINEITKFNFEEGIAELLDMLKVADFVAVDATVETTGFLMKNEEFNEAYMTDLNDHFGAWYDNIKDKDSTHCLLEVGLAIFRRLPTGGLETEVYNIPLLPACLDDNEGARFRGRTSVRVKMDGYGEEFITSVGFDINKPFYMAAPYLNRNLCEVADQYMKENPTFMVDSRKRAMNPCLNPTIYDVVTEKERKEIIERLRGVSKVFEAIAACGIPVVGHNLFLQMMFIYKDFIEYLPDTFPEYLDKMTSMFKLMYDTKQMARDIKGIPEVPSKYRDRLDELKLYSLLRNLNYPEEMGMFTVFVSNRVKSYLEDAIDICLGEVVERDKNSYCYIAGFDALISGLVFLDLISILELNQIDCWLEPEPEFPEPSAVAEIASLVFTSEETDEDKKEKNAEAGPGTRTNDYFQKFMKGCPARFKNRRYEEPPVPVPSERGERFEKLTEEKRRMWRKIREERRSVLRATVVNGVRTLSGADV